MQILSGEEVQVANLAEDARAAHVCAALLELRPLPSPSTQTYKLVNGEGLLDEGAPLDSDIALTAVVLEDDESPDPVPSPHPYIQAFADLATHEGLDPNDLDLYEEFDPSDGSSESEETLAARLDLSEWSVHIPDTRAGARDYDSYDSQNRRGRSYGYIPAGRAHYDRPGSSERRHPPRRAPLSYEQRAPGRQAVYWRRDQQDPTPEDDSTEGEIDSQLRDDEDESLDGASRMLRERDKRRHEGHYIMSGRNQSASPTHEAEGVDHEDLTPHDEPHDRQQPAHGYGPPNAGDRDGYESSHDDGDANGWDCYIDPDIESAPRRFHGANPPQAYDRERANTSRYHEEDAAHPPWHQSEGRRGTPLWRPPHLKSQGSVLCVVHGRRRTPGNMIPTQDDDGWDHGRMRCAPGQECLTGYSNSSHPPRRPRHPGDDSRPDQPRPSPWTGRTKTRDRPPTDMERAAKRPRRAKPDHERGQRRDLTHEEEDPDPAALEIPTLANKLVEVECGATARLAEDEYRELWKGAGMEYEDESNEVFWFPIPYANDEPAMPTQARTAWRQWNDFATEDGITWALPGD